MLKFSREIIRSLKNGRGVNTWSPLAIAFNSSTTKNYAFRSPKKETGLFGMPELKTANGFDVLKNEAITHSDQLIDEALDKNRKRKMVDIFDELSDTLCRVADLAEFVRIAHPDFAYAEAAQDACITISGIVEKLNTHVNLYNALKSVITNGDIQPTSTLDNHVGKLFLFDFEQCGIHLPEDSRIQVVQLNDDILQIGQKFMASANSARAINIHLLPEDVRKYFTTEGNEVIVRGFYINCSNTEAREAAYKSFLYPDAEQEKRLHKLLDYRYDMAQLCGFPTYAHRAVKGSTVETPTVVNDFLNILNDKLKDKAMQDFKEMQKMKHLETCSQMPIMPWDTIYFTAKAKKDWLNMSTTEFSPYFSLGACMDGINTLTQALYGVRLEPEPVLSGEVWAENVYKLAVIDQDEKVLGHIYCDFYEREGKLNQDCHFTIRGGRELANGTYQNPIVVLHLSLPTPKWSTPCLLHPTDVDNLFHEMGHALHSMLGRTKYQHVTGTRCCTDFAEVPSILMEYFASDPRVLSSFAKHYETQESIPVNMLDKLCASKNIFCASELQNQVFYSMLDQVYHADKLIESSTAIVKKIQGEYHSLPYIENTAWQLRFSHLVGYGAKYYSYLISRAIASWIWHTYFQADPFSRSSGERYRHECLAHGGGKPPSKLVSDFLNQEASAHNFAISLLNEVDIRNEQIQKIKR